MGLKNGGRVSPINFLTFAGTQNGELEKLVRPLKAKPLKTRPFCRFY